MSPPSICPYLRFFAGTRNLEVTGGTFWKPYTPAQIAGEEEFVLKKGPAGLMLDKNALMQYYDPIDLRDKKLRKLAKEIGPAWVRAC